mmetsp:Transcript_50290/g.151394  ORF Transcript_50290/g.151394 Transcript_50290/m.151394 type:complete len:328 (+) Transcript_50290:153-1136(+)
MSAQSPAGSLYSCHSAQLHKRGHMQGPQREYDSPTHTRGIRNHEYTARCRLFELLLSSTRLYQKGQKQRPQNWVPYTCGVYPQQVQRPRSLSSSELHLQPQASGKSAQSVYLYHRKLSSKRSERDRDQDRAQSILVVPHPLPLLVGLVRVPRPERPPRPSLLLLIAKVLIDPGPRLGLGLGVALTGHHRCVYGIGVGADGGGDGRRISGVGAAVLGVREAINFFAVVVVREGTLDGLPFVPVLVRLFAVATVVAVLVLVLARLFIPLFDDIVVAVLLLIIGTIFPHVPVRNALVVIQFHVPPRVLGGVARGLELLVESELGLGGQAR